MTDERIVAYLLMELPEEEAERFEDECFAEESWPSQIDSVEEDLIDAYLRNELTPEQRQRFERNYLTTEARLERVALAAAFLRHVDTLPLEVEPLVPAPPPAKPTLLQSLIALWERQTWGLRAGVAVGVIAIIAGSLWLSRSQTPRTFATLSLTISLANNRAEGVQPSRVSLPSGTDALRVSMKLPEQTSATSRYRVELVHDDGEISSRGIAEQQNGFVSIDIPATLLTRGQYALRLFAMRPDGTEQRLTGNYFFNVE
jgi:hypothetical protein